MSRTSNWLAAFAVATVPLTAAGCDGSETNWDGSRPAPQFFTRCFVDFDCALGSCICGACTLRCSDDSSCSSKEIPSGCSLGASESYVAQCGGPAPSDQGVCLPKCDEHRPCLSGEICAGGLCAKQDKYTEPLVVADRPPPPISGGTLTLIDANRLAASDPDHDRVHIVSLAAPHRVIASVSLEEDDEPGRLVADRNGIVHVVLRRGGAIAAIDPVQGIVRERRSVCQYPRGIAYDSQLHVLHVACAGGELVTLPADGGAASRAIVLDDDLRDVVIDGDHLLVSRFRSAELLVVDANSTVTGRVKPPNQISPRHGVPAVAWRTIAAPGGGAIMVHEVDHGDAGNPVRVAPGGYGQAGIGCDSTSLVNTAITKLRMSGTAWSAVSVPAELAIDVATNAGQIVVAAAGTRSPNATVLVFPELRDDPSPGDCSIVASAGTNALFTTSYQGQVVAVAYDSDGEVIFQTREPAQIVFGNDVIVLEGPSRKDTGHELFHTTMPSSGLACASCHPEGTEDGRVWAFQDLGPRRTQSVAGGISGTAPFHWSGDMNDFGMLVHQVMTLRMSGFRLDDDQIAALSRWIDTIPAWTPRASDALAVIRGHQIFTDETVGCAKCHAGDTMTNNQNVDVGTGAPFQVPSLRGVSRRPPFMHDGCASTLADRFGPCGGGDAHGHVSDLSAGQRADLIAYLSSL